MKIFLLEFKNADGEVFAREICGPSLAAVIAYVEKKDGLTFVSEIEPR